MASASTAKPNAAPNIATISPCEKTEKNVVSDPPTRRSAQPERERHEADQPEHGRERDRHAVALVQRAKRPRPRELDVRPLAYLRHRPRHIDGELVRRRVLARVVARAAVVAEIGEVVNVQLVEVEPTRHRGEHRAKPFAVATRVADAHLPFDFQHGVE